MLNGEFLDREFIIDETLKNILKAIPNDDYDAEFSNVKYFIAEVRSYLYELPHYNVDFLEEGTAGNKFVSHLIMSKLPKVVVKELINKISKNYPTLSEIFSNYKEALKTLSRTAPINKKLYRDSKKPNGNSTSVVQANEIEEKIPTVQNFDTVTIANKSAKNCCKLCFSDGHSLGKCETYVTYESKLARIMELSLCTRCAGSGHKESECYGKKVR